jgi:hypothetical protein
MKPGLEPGFAQAASCKSVPFAYPSFRYTRLRGLIKGYSNVLYIHTDIVTSKSSACAFTSAQPDAEERITVGWQSCQANDFIVRSIYDRKYQ